MAEYIDRESVIKEINSQRGFYFSEREGETDFEKLFLLYGSDNALSTMEDIVSDIPAADVVPVVRCNECKHHEIEPEKLKLGDIPPKQGECWCNWWDSTVNLSGFCSRGERIEE